MPRNKRLGRLTKKNKVIAKARLEEDDGSSKIPHSFIIHKGRVGKSIQQLQRDFRKVMEPNTASKLKERKKNTIKDFVSVSGPMNVAHLIIFNRTDVGLYMKMCRMPRGPSITFKISNYSLSRDVISSLKKQMTYGSQFLFSPCLMTNLQPDDGDNHLQLVCRMFLDMFPTITPNETKISTLRRCCLLNYNSSTEEFDFRHYSIRVVPVGISKAVKKLVGNKVPNLSRYNDMTEYLEKAGLLSESEGEEDVNSHVQDTKKEGQKSSVRLTELGPRLTMQLIKVQEGLFEGTMLYHKLVHKTEEEKRELEKKWAKKRKLKERRKKEQDTNVEKKKKLKEDHKQKCIGGMKSTDKDKKEDNTNNGKEKQLNDDDDWEDVINPAHAEDDDAQYYLEEVGEKPDPDLFKKQLKRKRHNK